MMQNPNSLDSLLHEIGAQFASERGCTGSNPEGLIPKDHVISVPYGVLQEKLDDVSSRARAAATIAGSQELSNMRQRAPGVLYLLRQAVAELDEQDEEAYIDTCGVDKLIDVLERMIQCP